MHVGLGSIGSGSDTEEWMDTAAVQLSRLIALIVHMIVEYLQDQYGDRSI